MSAAEASLPAEHVAHPIRPIANVPGRLGLWPLNVVRARIAMPWKRPLREGRPARAPKVRYWEKQFLSLTDEEMLDKSMELRGRARGKWDLDRLLPEAFGLVCVAIQRALDMRPFDVQLAAGVVMHYGGLVELATGEGKTRHRLAARPSSTPWSARASTSPPSTTTWPSATPSGSGPSTRRSA